MRWRGQKEERCDCERKYMRHTVLLTMNHSEKEFSSIFTTEVTAEEMLHIPQHCS